MVRNLGGSNWSFLKELESISQCLSNGTNVASQLVNFFPVFTSLVYGSILLLSYFQKNVASSYRLKKKKEEWDGDSSKGQIISRRVHFIIPLFSQVRTNPEASKDAARCRTRGYIYMNPYIFRLPARTDDIRVRTRAFTHPVLEEKRLRMGVANCGKQ